MENPQEILFSTCNELLSKKARTYAEFVKECEKDRVLGEGVRAVCEAMVRYAHHYAHPYKLQLQEALATISKLTEIRDKENATPAHHHG